MAAVGSTRDPDSSLGHETEPLGPVEGSPT